MYHRPKRIESLVDALDPKEVEILGKTAIEKIISKPKSFIICQFWPVRHRLHAHSEKQYEIWFLFVRKPVRMSLEEFSYVTSLNCKKIFKKKKNTKRKRKNPTTEKLYWGGLFGTLKFYLIDLAIKMLKKIKEGHRPGYAFEVHMPSFYI